MSKKPVLSAKTLRAIEIVGRNLEGNRSIHSSPEKIEKEHLNPLMSQRPDSAPLIEIIESIPVRDAFGFYYRYNKRANSSQSSYKRQKKWILWPSIGAVFISVVFLLVTTKMLASFVLWLGWDTSYLAGIEVFLRAKAPWLVIFLLGLSSLASWFLNPAEAYDKWTNSRGKAEMKCQEIFELVLKEVEDKGEIDGTEPSSGLTDRLMLALEYFRRWQVEVQNVYFKKRGAEHLKKVNRFEWLQRAYHTIFIVLLVFFFLSFIGGMDEQGVSKVPAGIGGYLLWFESIEFDLWLIGFAMAISFVALYSYTTLGSSKRNSVRYRKTSEEFELLLGTKLTDARLAAEQGNIELVGDYFDRVHVVMAVERDEWVRLAELDVGKLGAKHLTRTTPVKIT